MQHAATGPSHGQQMLASADDGGCFSAAAAFRVVASSEFSTEMHPQYALLKDEHTAAGTTA